MQQQIPPSLKNGFHCEQRADGRVRVSIVRDGAARGYLECTEAQLGRLASSLLLAAFGFAADRLTPPSDLLGSDFTIHTIPLTRVALGTNPDPDLETVAVQVGETCIGFGFPREALKSLGQSMVAASAEKNATH